MSRSRDREMEFTAFVKAGSASLLRAALVLLDTREEAEDAVQTVPGSERAGEPGDTA